VLIARKPSFKSAQSAPQNAQKQPEMGEIRVVFIPFGEVQPHISHFPAALKPTFFIFDKVYATLTTCRSTPFRLPERLRSSRVVICITVY
jgi:hypothetical protein